MLAQTQVVNSSCLGNEYIHNALVPQNVLPLKQTICWYLMYGWDYLGGMGTIVILLKVTAFTLALTVDMETWPQKCELCWGFLTALFYSHSYRLAANWAIGGLKVQNHKCMMHQAAASANNKQQHSFSHFCSTWRSFCSSKRMVGLLVNEIHWSNSALLFLDSFGVCIQARLLPCYFNV